jgi:hypothetical protein
VISVDWHSIATDVLALVVFVGAAFYGAYVLITYLTYGARPRPHVDLLEPARSAENLAEWAGVNTVALGVRVATPVFAMLSEASADVGDWFLRNHRPQTH